ncbi:hypothetical protein JTE90_006126 [Oedothorax gibbosus]|uniref:Serine/threonine-protein kinase WNK CCTL2 domain-containing protein n=1 Tax=Oedothorax gibbosus TaxID=931172 RepID=A0AAV6V3N8_9ARAC|nr:hypothetical protein JTE90_006126 [Oedothorax gibbosus]
MLKEAAASSECAVPVFEETATGTGSVDGEGGGEEVRRKGGKGKRRRTQDRSPRLTVISVEETMVECQLESTKGKTVTFKFDYTDTSPEEIANKLVITNLLAEHHAEIFTEFIQEVVRQLRESPERLPTCEPPPSPPRRTPHRDHLLDLDRNLSLDSQDNSLPSTPVQEGEHPSPKKSPSKITCTEQAVPSEELDPDATRQTGAVAEVVPESSQVKGVLTDHARGAHDFSSSNSSGGSTQHSLQQRPIVPDLNILQLKLAQLTSTGSGTEPPAFPPTAVPAAILTPCPAATPKGGEDPSTPAEAPPRHAVATDIEGLKLELQKIHTPSAAPPKGNIEQGLQAIFSAAPTPPLAATPTQEPAAAACPKQDATQEDKPTEASRMVSRFKVTPVVDPHPVKKQGRFHITRVADNTAEACCASPAAGSPSAEGRGPLPHASSNPALASPLPAQVTRSVSDISVVAPSPVQGAGDTQQSNGADVPSAGLPNGATYAQVVTQNGPDLARPAAEPELVLKDANANPLQGAGNGPNPETCEMWECNDEYLQVILERQEQERQELSRRHQQELQSYRMHHLRTHVGRNCCLGVAQNGGHPPQGMACNGHTSTQPWGGQQSTEPTLDQGGLST